MGFSVGSTRRVLQQGRTNHQCDLGLSCWEGAPQGRSWGCWGPRGDGELTVRPKGQREPGCGQSSYRTAPRSGRNGKRWESCGLRAFLSTDRKGARSRPRWVQCRPRGSAMPSVLLPAQPPAQAKRGASGPGRGTSGRRRSARIPTPSASPPRGRLPPLSTAAAAAGAPFAASPNQRAAPPEAPPPLFLPAARQRPPPGAERPIGTRAACRLPPIGASARGGGPRPWYPSAARCARAHRSARAALFLPPPPPPPPAKTGAPPPPPPHRSPPPFPPPLRSRHAAAMELITILEKTVSPGKAARFGPCRGCGAPRSVPLPPSPVILSSSIPADRPPSPHRPLGAGSGAEVPGAGGDREPGEFRRFLPAAPPPSRPPAPPSTSPIPLSSPPRVRFLPRPLRSAPMAALPAVAAANGGAAEGSGRATCGHRSAGAFPGGAARYRGLKIRRYPPIPEPCGEGSDVRPSRSSGAAVAWSSRCTGEGICDPVERGCVGLGCAGGPGVVGRGGRWGRSRSSGAAVFAPLPRVFLRELTLKLC